MKKPPLAVSVVVPTFRRPDLLRRCLEALLRQDLSERYEIIVADDAAEAETERRVRSLAGGPARPSIRVVAVHGRHGPAAARNRGWRAAQAPIIGFTDDDCIPDPGWLRAGLRGLRPGTLAVSGRLVVPLPERPTDYERDAARLAECEFVTANCFCRREALEAIGGFDERFRMAWREDSDLQFRLMSRGPIARAPAARVVHPVRPASWGVSLAAQRKVYYDALLLKKFPELYRSRIKPRPAWRYYAMMGSLLAAGAALAAGKKSAGGLALAAWVGLTGQWTARRLHGTSHAWDHVAEMALTSALIPPLALYWRLRGAIRFRVAFL